MPRAIKLMMKKTGKSKYLEVWEAFLTGIVRSLALEVAVAPTATRMEMSRWTPMKTPSRAIQMIYRLTTWITMTRRRREGQVGSLISRDHLLTVSHGSLLQCQGVELLP